MTDFKHEFDPDWQQLFLQQYNKFMSSGQPDEIDISTLFYQLNQTQALKHGVYHAYQFLNCSIARSNQFVATRKLNHSFEHLDQLSGVNISALPANQYCRENVKQCAEQAAVIELTQTRWLENINHAYSSRSEIACHLMSLYLKANKSDEGDDLSELFQSLMFSLGGKLPLLHSSKFFQHSNIRYEVLEFATIRLALAQFPRVYFAEILGFTLACLQLPTLIEICFPGDKTGSAYFSKRQQSFNQQISDLKLLIERYIALFPQYEKQLRIRIAQGFWLYHCNMQCCRDALHRMFDEKASPDKAMLVLLKTKAIAAIGHHKNIELQGKSLDDWFKGLPDNNQAFLQALKESNYIDSENPLDSQLLSLFEFGGPMFGVINQTERDVLLDWIIDENKVDLSGSIRKAELTESSEKRMQSFDSSQKFSQLTNRQLYYYLVNKDLFPDVLSKAHWRVRTLLRLCNLFNPPPFKQYSHTEFDMFIDKIYQQEIAAYKPLTDKPKISKAAYVWGLEQVAPMILIDGCWLQNSLTLKHSYPEISDILYQIYCDELGNGHLVQNHPHIFQNLLESLKIEIPDVQSQAFVEHTGFLKSAFDLPVYMLSLSCFSVEFLPELLGLNMAIELSGLGKSYMNLVDEWNYWDIDPAIAKIHISIDNFESGHTFMAKKAIQIYMDDVLKRTGDNRQLNQHWRRIFCGYASLRFVGKRFKLALPVQYLKYKFSN